MSEDPAAKPAPEPEPLSIEKPPPGEILARFKTKRSPDERIQTLLPALPHLKISDAKDYVRLHPDDAYWSDEYCFVMVPVPGLKDSVLHLLASDLAETRPPGSLQYFRLALATKPHNQFFLAHVPSRNLDNEWNRSRIQTLSRRIRLRKRVAVAPQLRLGRLDVVAFQAFALPADDLFPGRSSGDARIQVRAVPLVVEIPARDVRQEKLIVRLRR